MPEMPRRTACKLCRDRKVRCDGNQPACNRCCRSSETCVYTPFYKPTKADLARIIENLRDRIDTAEAFMKQHQTVATTNNSPIPPSSAPELATGMDLSNSSSFHVPFTPNMDLNDQLLFSNTNTPSSSQYDSHSMVPFHHGGMEGSFLNMPMMPGYEDMPLQFQVDDLTPPSDNASNGNDAQSSSRENDSSMQENDDHQTSMPSLQEIRALDLPPNRSNTDYQAARSANYGPGERSEDNYKIIKELGNFSSAIFAIQADMSGISSAVADYLAWARTSPSRASRTDDFVLATLETRVRELHEMAETRHRAAWMQLIGRLENLDGVDAELKVLDGAIQRYIKKTKHFFESNYNVSVMLSEQIANTP